MFFVRLAEIIRRAACVLRAIDGREGLNQLDRNSVAVLLVIAEAELAGKAPEKAAFIGNCPQGRAAALSRLGALERSGWLSSSLSADGISRYIHLTPRARSAFVQTAAQLKPRRG